MPSRRGRRHRGGSKKAHRHMSPPQSAFLPGEPPLPPSRRARRHAMRRRCRLSEWGIWSRPSRRAHVIVGTSAAAVHILTVPDVDADVSVSSRAQACNDIPGLQFIKGDRSAGRSYIFHRCLSDLLTGHAVRSVRTEDGACIVDCFCHLVEIACVRIERAVVMFRPVFATIKQPLRWPKLLENIRLPLSCYV